MKKRGKQQGSAEQRQLFNIFEDLSVKVSDKDDYGSLIGDTIFEALCKFHFHSTSTDERQLKEVKRVYERFEKLNEEIDLCGDYHPINLASQQRIEKYLGTLKNKRILNLDQIDYSLKSGLFKGSVIFYGILNTPGYKEGALDKLRRYGLGLDNRVRERGGLSGNRNCLLSDYQDIYKSFVRTRGDRRE